MSFIEFQQFLIEMPAAPFMACVFGLGLLFFLFSSVVTDENASACCKVFSAVSATAIFAVLAFSMVALAKADIEYSESGSVHIVVPDVIDIDIEQE